jgi:hypothetical protein
VLVEICRGQAVETDKVLGKNPLCDDNDKDDDGQKHAPSQPSVRRGDGDVRVEQSSF